MTITILILLLILIIIYIMLPFLVPFIITIDTLNKITSLLFGIILVFLFGWYGVIFYVLLALIINNSNFKT